MEQLTIDVREWVALTQETGAAIPVSFAVVTDSMQPLIRPKRDVVTVAPLQTPPGVGDIVLFARQTRNPTHPEYCLHRVVQCAGDTVTTWGDNCRFPDAQMPLSAVLGIAVCVKRNGKTIRLDTPRGRRNRRLSRLLLRWVWRVRGRVHSAFHRLIRKSDSKQ